MGNNDNKKSNQNTNDLTWVELLYLQDETQRLLSKLMPPFEFSYRDLMMLASLDEVGDAGIELSKHILMLRTDENRYSLRVRNLFKKRYIEKIRGNEDARIITIRLSPAGKQMLEEFRVYMKKTLEPYNETITEDAKKRLRMAVDNLYTLNVNVAAVKRKLNGGYDASHDFCEGTTNPQLPIRDLK